ncbi:hypothetical protein [Deinococcus sp.]|uniref:hypothetical protein n=1 Tax=Deinococcus sp. TaxID=47478 RepID=UPI002869CA18|nr:hypothetical protein [Deinococcus sp.]
MSMHTTRPPTDSREPTGAAGHLTSPIAGSSSADLERPVPIPFDVNAMARMLVIATVAVIFMGIVSRVASGVKTDFPFRDLIVPMFALGSEANIPSVFSGVILSVAAIVAWVIARGKRQQGDHFQRHWMGVSYVFVYLAIDEVAQIHDRATTGVRNILGDSAIFHYAWVVPYFFVVVGVIVWSIPFLRHLPRRTAGGMMLAGAMYVMGAMGLEVIEGALEYLGLFHSVAMPVLVTIEESLEMFSVVLFIWLLLDYLRSYLSNLHLDLSFIGGRTR